MAAQAAKQIETIISIERRYPADRGSWRFKPLGQGARRGDLALGGEHLTRPAARRLPVPLVSRVRAHHGAPYTAVSARLPEFTSRPGGIAQRRISPRLAWSSLENATIWAGSVIWAGIVSDSETIPAQVAGGASDPIVRRLPRRVQGAGIRFGFRDGSRPDGLRVAS